MTGTTVRRLVLLAVLWPLAGAAAAQQAPPPDREAPVEVDSACLTPAYPMILKMAGVSGRITLSFVVDTTGRADTSTVRVIDTSHALLVAPARTAATACRFHPARQGGVPVRARILRRFAFVPPDA